MNQSPTKIEFEALQRSLLTSFREQLRASMLVINQGLEDGENALRIVEWRSGKVNARVDLLPERAGLEYRFTHGLCLGIFDACETLIQHPSFCSDHSLDGCEYLTITGHTMDIRERFANYTSAGSVFRRGLPLTTMLFDGPRREIGDILFSLAIKFVSLHEQGHVYQGHLNLRRRRGVPLCWMEMNSGVTTEGSEEDDISAQDRRALELQADGFASKVLISLNATKGTEKLFPDNQVMSTPVDWIFFSVIAATVVFGILDITDRGSFAIDPEARLHPPAPIRLLGVFAELRQTLFEQVPDEQQRNVFMARLLSECEVVFEVLGTRTLDARAFNAYFSRSGTVPPNEQADELWHYVQRLHELEPELGETIRDARAMFRL